MDNLLKMNCFSSLYRAIFYEEYKFWSSLIVHTANFEWWRWWWLQSRCTYILKKILPRASIDYMWLWSLKLIIGNGSQDVFIEVVDLSYLQYYVITWRALVDLICLLSIPAWLQNLTGIHLEATRILSTCCFFVEKIQIYLKKTFVFL